MAFFLLQNTKEDILDSESQWGPKVTMDHILWPKKVIFQNVFLLCCTEERKSYRFGTTLPVAICITPFGNTLLEVV